MSDTRRCAIWYGHGSTRCTACAGRASSSPGSCCVMDATMAGRPGPGCIAGLKFEQAVHHIVLEDYIAAAEARRNGLTAQIEAMLPDWTLAPVVAALQTMRGMALVNAASLIAELGDLSRFANPRQLMAYLGLVPSEHSSGASIKRGSLTKAGNGAARRLLIEAAWTPAFAGAGPAASRPGSAANCCSGRRSSPSRSARSPGRRSCDCARAIASSPVAASRPMSSLPRLPVSWPASSGPSPGACRRRPADRKKPVIASEGGASEPPNTLLPGKAGGAAAVRRTLDTTICRVADPTQVSRPRQLRDASTVMRFRPAHQSMINRRFNDRASCPARKSPKHALARKPPIHSPASGKGGHESGKKLRFFADRAAKKWPLRGSLKYAGVLLAYPP